MPPLPVEPSPSSPFFGTTALRCSVSYIGEISANLAHFDTVELGLAPGLEVWVGELPDVLLDLSRVVVDVLDLGS